MIIGNKNFEENRTHIMGILNVTPDSFSDGGCYNSTDAALRHAEQMLRDGAEIIDIGGESTRPGYTMISDEEEITRIVPVIKAVKRELGAVISADTYKSGVARAALEAGADMINDIWGFKYDPKIAGITKEFDVPVCLMHNRKNTDYGDFLKDIISDLQESVDIALNAGISKDKIIIDPGIGFAKSLEQNLLITKHLEQLHSMGYPVLYASSRKSMIGLTLGLPASERVEGTAATTVIACMKGAMFVRVHDVKENCRVIKMTEAVINS